MSNLIVLGTANAIPTKDHENTHFVLSGDDSSILIDCVGNEILRLEEVGVDLASISDIVLTHCHPDHISGVPPMLMSLSLMVRKAPLNSYGLDQTRNSVEMMMVLYEWEDWPNFFPLAFQRLPEEEMTLVLETKTFRIYSSPVCHIIPTIGLRIEATSTGKVVAYSCDTEPCDQVVALARDADILIHESTGKSFGHSSSAQAGEIAQEAGAKSLYLIHYPPHLYGDRDLLDQAKACFTGEVRFATDGLEINF